MLIQTKITTVKPNTNSIKTTIPREIAAFLDLNVGDYLSWEIKTENDSRVVLIRKN